MDSYFDARGNEIIPSCNGSSSRPDPTERDRVVLTGHCAFLRRHAMHTEYNRESGELRFRVFDGLVNRDSFNKTLSYARAEFGKENVKSIVVYVLNDDGCDDQESTLAALRMGINLSSLDRKQELIRQLLFQGYQRRIVRETDPLFMCFVKSPARQWTM